MLSSGIFKSPPRDSRREGSANCGCNSARRRLDSSPPAGSPGLLAWRPATSVFVKLSSTRAGASSTSNRRIQRAARSPSVSASNGRANLASMSDGQNNFSTPRVAVSAGPKDYRDNNALFQLVNHTLSALSLHDAIIQPGDRVVLKPNWIKEHDERFPGPNHWQHVITHPAVIEAVARWTSAHLRGRGSITICDAPQTDSSFDRIREYCELDSLLTRLRKAFPGVDFSLLDLRPEEWHAIDGVTVARTKLSGDPRGNTHVRLDSASEFVGYHGQGRLYGASFDMAETNEKHIGKSHEYLLCRTPMDADVFVNLPKLKTHKKVGMTCALKNLVGINANKNWLPHHTEGTPDQGGDQFAVATARARLEHSWMGAAKR